MKKYILFLIIGLISENCIAMQNEKNGYALANQMYSTINSYSDSEENIILKIRELLMKGVNLNYDLGGGFTSVHYAVLSNKPKVCQFLIEEGACPHIENCDDRTALDLAAGRGHPLYDLVDNKTLLSILKSSSNSVFKPGMNRSSLREKKIALQKYNKRYQLDLDMD